MRLATALAIVVLGAPALAPAADLTAVLASMDTAAASFADVTAKLEKEVFTAVINDRETEQGEMWMIRSSRDVHLRVEFGEPNLRSIAVAGRKAEMFFPKINLINEYSLQKLQDVVDQFLLLGFGTRGTDLSKDYAVKLLGEEDVKGTKAAKLELVPKDRKDRERLSRAELWIAEPGGYPVRQKFYWPSDDTHTITYFDVKLNQSLSAGDVTLKLPANVKREFPQR